MKRSIPKAQCKPWEHRLSRRQWLGGAAGSTLAMGSLLQSSVALELKKQHKQVLFIWLDGGMSQLESWDPKPETEFGGPFRAIETSVPGIRISELMPRTAKQMHHLAIVRSMCTKDPNHSSAVPRIQRGDPKNRGVVYPYFGSAVTQLMGPNDSGMAPYVLIKPGSGGFIYQDSGFLGPQYGALAFGDGRPPENLTKHPSLTKDQVLDRTQLRLLADQRYAQSHRPLTTQANTFVFDMGLEMMKHMELFDESTYTKRDEERYGKHDLGRHLLLAKRMLQAGVSFVKVNSYGWDSHGDNFNACLTRVPRFDQAFASIIEDLASEGMLDHVLVIAMSEFGRTPRINGHMGRDHWPESWSLAMAGCGIRRGLAVGETNARGTFVKSDGYDIGHMFHTWFSALGIDPSTTQYNNHGQPLPIAHEECQAVKELLA